MQEAGAHVSTMDGKPYTVFDRSVLASNGRLHDAVRILCFCFALWSSALRLARQSTGAVPSSVLGPATIAVACVCPLKAVLRLCRS